MLTREVYTEWADRFATMHGFRFGEEMDTLYSWYDVLGHYTEAELEFARLYIARGTGDVPRDKTGYRSLIHRAVNACRAERHQQLDDAAKFGTCANCGGCGLMVVPHPKCVSQGEWIPPYAELGVTCNCRAGVLRRQSYHDDKRGWSIERYDSFFPGWRKAQLKMKSLWSAENRVLRQFGQKPMFDPLKEVLCRLRAKFGGREPGIDEE